MKLQTPGYLTYTSTARRLLTAAAALLLLLSVDWAVSQLKICVCELAPEIFSILPSIVAVAAQTAHTHGSTDTTLSSYFPQLLSRLAML
jgi:hypothetical protein